MGIDNTLRASGGCFVLINNCRKKSLFGGNSFPFLFFRFSNYLSLYMRYLNLAPTIDGYIKSLAHRYRQINQCSIPFDDQSVKDIDEIFRLIKQIKPTREDDGVRDLWLSADRGSIEEFGDYD